MRNRAFLLAGLLIFSACRDGPTGVPEELLGTYRLHSIDGVQGPIPYGNHVKIESGSLTLHADRSFDRVYTLYDSDADSTWTGGPTESGTFRVKEGIIKLKGTYLGDYSGTISADLVTLPFNRYFLFSGGSSSLCVYVR